MKYRKLSKELKKQLVEQMINGTMSPTEICRQNDIARTVLYRWQKQYEAGELDNAPTNALMAAEIKIKELERLVGRLTLDNEILKKAIKQTYKPSKISTNSSEKTKVYSGALPEGAKC
jgi:transposase